ncbi:hypothetical protein R1flu_018199 [Riccia fluitans]|uniref:Uncharacterized protein n=1 Tax=Riccia fluitans TaxID=41844 RepID=A0ABD1ZF52_9MARC
MTRKGRAENEVSGNVKTTGEQGGSGSEASRRAEHKCGRTYVAEALTNGVGRKVLGKSINVQTNVWKRAFNWNVRPTAGPKLTLVYNP